MAFRPAWERALSEANAPGADLGTVLRGYLRNALDRGVYRDPSPRAALVAGDMLTETFGIAGIYFARQATAEANAKAVERLAFHVALNEVALGIAGAADAVGVA